MPIQNNSGASTLMMAFDDDENSLGLLMDDESGLYARADGRWFTISSGNATFDGAEVVEVDDDILDFYDKLEKKGIEPTYDQVQAYAVEDSDSDSDSDIDADADADDSDEEE